MHAKSYRTHSLYGLTIILLVVSYSSVNHNSYHTWKRQAKSYDLSSYLSIIGAHNQHNYGGLFDLKMLNCIQWCSQVIDNAWVLRVFLQTFGVGAGGMLS